MVEGLKEAEDAYGNEILDFMRSGKGYEILERDDGFFDISDGPSSYFIEFEKWPSCEKEAICHAKGLVLDVGVGAGRVSLYLQNRGNETVGIDNSPLACQVASERGVKNVKLASFDTIAEREFPYDTVIMYGNNFGLFHNRENARRLLKYMHQCSGANTRLIVESLDPYLTESKENLEYHEFNQSRGRMAGQISIRVHYRKYVTPWFEYLLVSRDEMSGIVKGTGWKISKFFGDGEALYCALITKE